MVYAFCRHKSHFLNKYLDIHVLIMDLLQHILMHTVTMHIPSSFSSSMLLFITGRHLTCAVMPILPTQSPESTSLVYKQSYGALTFCYTSWSYSTRAKMSKRMKLHIMGEELKLICQEEETGILNCGFFLALDAFPRLLLNDGILATNVRHSDAILLIPFIICQYNKSIFYLDCISLFLILS
jgi:hypothetical protein